MATASLYPPSPVGLPPDLTRVSSAYRRRMVAMLVSLVLFIVVYLALLAGSAWLTYWIATHNFSGRRGDWNPLLNGLGAVAAGMLFLFLFKGLFKSHRFDRSHLLEIKREQQPELFAFLDRLCSE